MWPRRDDDAAAVAEVELQVVPRILDPLLPRPDDGVPVDPRNGQCDDDDAEDDAELGWRVQAVPFVVCAPRAVIASCFMPGKQVGLVGMGLKRWHGRHVSLLNGGLAGVSNTRIVSSRTSRVENTALQQVEGCRLTRGRFTNVTRQQGLL